MNEKAQVGIGSFIVVFILVIVGAALFLDVAQTVGVSSDTISLAATDTVLAADLPDAIDTKIDLVGQDLLSTPVVTNGTGLQAVAAGNYTIGEHVSATTGVKSIYFQLDDPTFTGANATANGALYLNISYDYGPDGYIDSAGGRGMAGLIPIFFALVIAIIALTPVLSSKILEQFGK